MRQKEFWITAHVLTKATVLTAQHLKTIRELNPQCFTVAPTGGYIYNANLIPEILKKKELIS